MERVCTRTGRMRLQYYVFTAEHIYTYICTCVLACKGELGPYSTLYYIILKMFQHSNVMAEMMEKKKLLHTVLEQTTISLQCFFKMRYSTYTQQACMVHTNSHYMYVHVQSDDVATQFWNQW